MRYISPFYSMPQILTEDRVCNKVREGGCPQYSSHRIKEVEGTGYTIETCKKKCQETTDCAVFFMGKRPHYDGVCHLYRRNAIDGPNKCTYSEDDKDYWAMYSLKSCDQGKILD